MKKQRKEPSLRDWSPVVRGVLVVMWLLVATAMVARAEESTTPASEAPAGEVNAGAPAAPGTTPTPTGTDPHEQIKGIMSRPIYQRWKLRQDDTTPANSALLETYQQKMDAFWAAVRDWIRGLFRSSVRNPITGGWNGIGVMGFLKVVGWIAIGLLILAVAILIARLMRGVKLDRNISSVLSREQVAEALKQGEALAMVSDDWLAEAQRLANENRFREVYRAMYLALLSGLHSRGKIDFRRHHTNWTYVNHFRGTSAEREVFSSLTDLFDNVWYGLASGGGADLAQLNRQVQTLISPTPTTLAAQPPTGGVDVLA